MLVRNSFWSCLILCCLTFVEVTGQNIYKARAIMDTLASPAMFGRGYVNDGCGIAAEYIANEMKNIGLKSFDSKFKQEFQVNVKTYPSKVSIKMDGKILKAGEEFSVMTGSPSVKGIFKIVVIDSSWFKRFRKIERLKKKDLSNTLIVYNQAQMKGKYKKMADSLLKSNYLGCAGFINVIDKSSVTWSVNSPEKILPYPVLTVVSSVMTSDPSLVEINIELKPIDEYVIGNVTGYIEGTAQPDSFVVITAHYDHLGMMGDEAFFPGANDNASGTAMMLDMASYYINENNRLPYSLVFMAFAGEEIGLKGSMYAADHPLFPLDKIKFLINLDMVGTGSEGITMVNGAQFPAYYDKMVKINADNEYILKVVKRGESCNSDHCPFYKKGVPAVFIYSMGNEHTEYHSLKDQAQKVPLTEYEDIFRLIRDFINTL